MENSLRNKESQSQQAVGYSLSLKLENNRSKLRGITPSLSNKIKDHFCQLLGIWDRGKG